MSVRTDHLGKKKTTTLKIDTKFTPIFLDPTNHLFATKISASQTFGFPTWSKIWRVT